MLDGLQVYGQLDSDWCSTTCIHEVTSGGAIGHPGLNGYMELALHELHHPRSLDIKHPACQAMLRMQMLAH